MPNLDAIAIFAKVAQFNSFTDAARTLGMPLSTVSRKVSELEVDLNARLIDRSKRQIRLTEAGITYLNLCQRGLNTINYANRIMTDRHSDTTGTVTITVPPNLLEVLFLDAIEDFQLQYPKARIRVLVSERMLDFVDDGVDLSFRVAPPEHPNLVVRTLLKYRHILLASPAYIAAHPGSYTPSELENYNTIGFGFHSSRQITWSLSYREQTEEIVFEPSLAINDYGAVRAALLSGKGIGELPEPLCRDDIRTGKLIEVLPGWRFPEIKFYAVHSGNASLSKLARLFLDIVFVKLKS